MSEIGNTGIQGAKFNTIDDVPLENGERTLQNTQVSQFTQLAGGNKAIILVDEKGNKRVYIGKKI